MYNYLGDNMKKVFLAVIVFILILFIIDINKFNNKLYKKIEQENIYIDEIYIYASHDVPRLSFSYSLRKISKNIFLIK